MTVRVVGYGYSGKHQCDWMTRKHKKPVFQTPLVELPAVIEALEDLFIEPAALAVSGYRLQELIRELKQLTTPAVAGGGVK